MDFECRTLSTLILYLIVAVFVSQSRDLTQESGHLKPFGEGRPSQPVPEINGFLNPEEFFLKHVNPLKPLKMQGAAKLFPAFQKWTDDYFLSVDEPPGHAVSVETVKKERRDQKMLSMPFKEFVKIYNTSTYYMVHAVPKFIQQDVLVPCPLQCRSVVEKSLADNVMWFSSGGTNSVVHTDSFDNMNCLLRGNKTLVLVDPALYKDKVDIDHPEGSYSNVDVDSVDYLKYPGLAEVEFYHVNVTAGDCLYIPYKWIHQVRSYGSNLAVNVWWHHYLKEEIQFDECNKQCDEALTLDKAVFVQGEGHTMSAEEIRDHFSSLISTSKALTFPRFVTKLVGGITEADIEENEDLRMGLMQIFSLVDQNKDGEITNPEIIETPNETYEEIWSIMSYLENSMQEDEADIGDYNDDDDLFDNTIYGDDDLLDNTIYGDDDLYDYHEDEIPYMADPFLDDESEVIDKKDQNYRDLYTESDPDHMDDSGIKHDSKGSDLRDEL